MHPGIVFTCDHNGIVLHVSRDDFGIFGIPSGSEHLSRYIANPSKEAASRFFSLLSSEGVSASGQIGFAANGSSKPFFCTGMRARDCFLIFGAADLPGLGTLITGTLYPEDIPVDVSQVCQPAVSPVTKRVTDYQIYEDLTRLNNELVNMSRELTDAQVEIEMNADELYKENEERRRAEEALVIAGKKLTLLSSITRHDINNQLTVLVGYLRIIEKKQPDTSSGEYFKKITTAAQRIAAMIQFTKEYEKVGVNAPAWQECRTLVDTAATETTLGNIMVKNDLPAGFAIFSDPLILKVFYNLMDNAVRYGGKITTIRFSVQKSGDDQLVVCEDDGDGVVAPEKEKIFERGFGKNTGLGLALSREILDITGITIKETGEPGRGARFEMTVPYGMWRMTGSGA